MAWQRIGGAVIGPGTEVADLGEVNASLSAGFLQVRMRSRTTENLRPLSFGIVIPVPAGDDHALPTARYYPQDLPGLVPLGPGIGDRFAGRLQFKPRRYNQRWLAAGYPGTTWSVIAEVWGGQSPSTPTFNVYGYATQEGLTFTLSGERVGPAGAAPLRRG